MTDICRCSAYRWPHASGVGFCHFAPEELMKVTRLVKVGQGLTLAETDTGHYLVGICYTIGMEINPTLNPYVDFLRTTSLPIAEHYFNAREKG